MFEEIENNGGAKIMLARIVHFEDLAEGAYIHSIAQSEKGGEFIIAAWLKRKCKLSRQISRKIPG